MASSPSPHPPLPRLAALDDATRRRAQIVVLHDPREDVGGVQWTLSLTDAIGRPIAREQLPPSDLDELAPVIAVEGCLYAIRMRTVGEWLTSPDELRHYARVAPHPQRG